MADGLARRRSVLGSVSEDAVSYLLATASDGIYSYYLRPDRKSFWARRVHGGYTGYWLLRDQAVRLGIPYNSPSEIVENWETFLTTYSAIVQL